MGAPKDPLRMAVLASGTGTLMEALIDELDGDGRIDIAMVGVDRSCRAEALAAELGPEVVRIDRSYGSSFDREDYTAQFTQALVDRRVELVAMAGFGTIFAPGIYDRFGTRVLNTHPSLLPAFPGWHAVRDALDHGVKVTGCTIHIATAVVDTGPILAQEPVFVEPDDTDEALHERIKAVERRLYPSVIRAIVEGGNAISAAVFGTDVNRRA